FVFQHTPELQQAARQASAPPTAREQAAPVPAAPPPPLAPSRPARVTASAKAPGATSPSPSANVVLSAPAQSRDEGSSRLAKAKTSEEREHLSLTRDQLVRERRDPDPAANAAPASPDASSSTRQSNDALKDAFKKES